MTFQESELLTDLNIFKSQNKVFFSKFYYVFLNLDHHCQTIYEEKKLPYKFLPLNFSEGKFIEQESRSVAAKNSGMWVEKGVGETTNRYVVSFQDDEMFWNQMVVIICTVL